jgi:hypothetical protein
MSGFARPSPWPKKAASTRNLAAISSSSASRGKREDGQPVPNRHCIPRERTKCFSLRVCEERARKHRNLENLKNLAKRMLALTDAEVETAQAVSELIEAPDDEEDKPQIS